jgi:hypothetical protein
MAKPSDLISHYSSQAFHTRIYALTFSGAVLAAALKWPDSTTQFDRVGLALVVVIGSLSALNWRYTHSYLAALLASRLETSPGFEEVEQWRYFSRINETPWSVLHRSVYHLLKWTQIKEKFAREHPDWSKATLLAVASCWVAIAAAKKFLLSWSTYLPGLIVGTVVIWPHKSSKAGGAGLIGAVIVCLVWIALSWIELDLDALNRLKEGLGSDLETSTTSKITSSL